MLASTVIDRLKLLQEKAGSKNKLEFSLTDEVIDTIGIFTLQTFFGKENAKVDAETVRIYDDNGLRKPMSFSMAYRTVFRQTMSKFESFLRCFLLDPLGEWCLTPFERKVRHN